MKFEKLKSIIISKVKALNILKSKDTYGIDLGSTSVKILHVQGKKVIRWAYKELDVNLTSADIPVEERMGAMIQLVKEFVTSEPKGPKTAAVSVSGNSVIVRYVKLPKLSQDELNKTIQFEAEPYIPFAIPEVNLSFHILNDVIDDGQQKMETVLVAAKKDLIDSRINVLTSVNLRPIIIDVDAFALENAYEHVFPPTNESESVLIVNVGANVTTMIIVDNGVAKVVRDVFISGNSINKSLQRIFDCSFDESEKLKRKGSILVTPDEKEATLAQDNQDALQVSNTIVTVVKDLVAEIQRSLDYYLSQNPENQVSRILLSGGSSKISGIDRYFSQELRMTVEIFDPFEGMEEDNLPDPSIRASFAVAMGLATRSEGDS